MKIHIKSSIQNLETKKQTLFLDGEASYCSSGDSCFFYLSEQNLSIPYLWILKLELNERDRIFLHHVSRNPHKFYNFDLIETILSFSTAHQREEVFVQLQAGIDSVAAISKKPKKLLAVLNPRAGWGKGLQVYDRIADPLFKLANVATERVNIRAGDDIEKVILASRLSDFDGVLSCGGDGTHAAVFGGVLRSVQRDNGINLNKEDPEMVSVDVPVGILPTGSGNGTSLNLNMTHDVQSCVVNMILGNCRDFDLISVHDVDQGYKFLKICHLLFQVGFFVDEAKKLERLRFLGPFRYLIFLVMLLFSMKPVPFHRVEYKRGRYLGSACESKEEGGKLGNCPSCKAPDGPDDFLRNDWAPLSLYDANKVNQLGGFNQKSRHQVKGMKDSSYESHFREGSFMVYASTYWSFRVLLKFLWIWYSDMVKSSSTKPPHWVRECAREARIKLKVPCAVACDGEILDPLSHIYAKVHRGVVKAYGTGVIEGHPEVVYSTTVAKWRRTLISILVALLVAIVGGIYALMILIKFIF